MSTDYQPCTQRRVGDFWHATLCRVLVLSVALVGSWAGKGAAHEGHDHDLTPQLNLPAAQRVVAVSPDFEIVGVLSGAQRLIVFVTRFETNEPVKGATLWVSAADQSKKAVAKGDGVFEVSAPWLTAPEPIDIIFRVALPDEEDLLTGRLEKGVPSSSSVPPSDFAEVPSPSLVLLVGAFVAGALLTLLIGGALARRRGRPWERTESGHGTSTTPDPDAKTKPARYRFMAVVVLALAGSLAPVKEVRAQTAGTLPSVPASTAPDAPQRMPDGTLFVPKATQHLLAVRTILTTEIQAHRTVRLIGTVIADPNSFGRVQTGHAGRIGAPQGGLAFIGKRVEKGDLLAYLEHHIEAYNKSTLQGEIAELEARIAVEENKLALYRKHPEVIPAVKIVETEGELRALRQKRNELLPTLSEREEIRAPISGVISSGNIVAGQVVDASEVLFEIVDPARFWVEAIAHDPHLIADLGKASAILDGGEALPLEFVGAGLTLKQQAAPLSFRVKQASPDLRIGMPVTVILQSTPEITGIVLPASSVIRSQSGLSVVWVKTDAERFEPRSVRVEPLDGQRVMVSAGLAPDMRVVTAGAILLNQIR